MQPVSQSEDQNSSTNTVCDVCKLQPLPQSTQYLPLIILQIFLIVVSFKLSLIVLLIGYFFSKSIWVCPMCKREVSVSSSKKQSTSQYIIIRLNDFMMLVSKLKFRIVAGVLILALGYWYVTQPTYQYTPRVNVQKTWKSIMTNCGYDAHIQNSFGSRYLYSLYEETTNWQLQGIFLSKQQPLKAGYATIKIKMIPTQFKDQNTEDIELLFHNTQEPFQKGDIVKFKGEWSGKRDYVLIFIASSLEKTGKKITNFQQVQVLSHGNLRQYTR